MGGWRATRFKEPAAGIWVDQLWADWAPMYFRHTIVRDSSLNVAFWNLDERDLHEADGKPAIEGAPLRHFHFAAFDPDGRTSFRRTWPTCRRHQTPSSPASWSSTPTVYGSAATTSCASALTATASARWGEFGPRERAIYREAVLAAEARSADLPPSPFDSSRSDDFDRLVDDPASLHAFSPQAHSASNGFALPVPRSLLSPG